MRRVRVFCAGESFLQRVVLSKGAQSGAGEGMDPGPVGAPAFLAGGGLNSSQRAQRLQNPLSGSTRPSMLVNGR
jgi:hypothetical protein